MKVKIAVLTTGFEIWYNSFIKESVDALFYSGVILHVE
jgi:hypothetical protein